LIKIVAFFDDIVPPSQNFGSSKQIFNNLPGFTFSFRLHEPFGAKPSRRKQQLLGFDMFAVWLTGVLPNKRYTYEGWS
jgi:hypothetical protein